MISVRDLSFSYGKETTVLEKIRFDIDQGEYVALMGENGCGKSTLVSCINGLLTPPPGAVSVYGLDVSAAVSANNDGDKASSFAGDLRQIRTLVGTVTQNPDSQIIGSAVEEDTTFGPENLGLSETEIKARVDRALAAVGLEGLRERPTQTLSGGEKQRLVIAGALAVGSPCLLLDEPTSMIDPESAERLLSVIDALNEAGTTIVHITHDLKHTVRARRCLVLHKGRLVFDGTPADLLKNPQLEPWGLKARAPLPIKNSPADNAYSIRFESVFFSYYSYKKNLFYKQHVQDASSGLYNVTVSIPQNSLVAVIGKSGCGKTTFLKHINGLLVPEAGNVSVAGKGDLFKRAALAIQSPESALFEAYVADDVAFAPRNAGIKGKPLVQSVKTAMEDAGLPFAEFAERETRSLSGGEKRRAALAGALAMDSKILLLDEPFAGLDAKNRAHIMNMVFEQQAKGKTIIVVTHSPDMVDAFDFVLAMDKGRIRAFGTPAEVLGAGEAKGKRTYPQTILDNCNRKEANPLPSLRNLGSGKKLLLLLGLGGVALAGNVFFPAGVMIFAFLAGVFWGRVSARFLLKSAFSSLPLLGIVVFFQLAFNWVNDESSVFVEFFHISITTAEVYRSISIVIRVFAIVVCLTLYSAVTPLRETLRAVNHFLVPLKFLHGRDIAMALGISLRFTPILAGEAERIKTAQRSRGGKKGVRGAFAVIIPLLLRALEKSETLASAMLLRLYPHPEG
ncbi:MAG: ATP-binding cassette domain-containing protein [Treponema sp.]|jgi:energy-coupling factor transport system ATP-binding protein|nr:ATP-binding cassette domain-containing protein [Treponema sp.]